MASGLVHEIQTFVALGDTYGDVHRRKDSAAAAFPGHRHRRIRHGWYQRFGRCWDFDTPFPESTLRRLHRFRTVSGPERAERYMASLSHDYLDRVWEYDDLPPEERRFMRKYSESFWVWVVLNLERPVVRDWAGIDVVASEVQRLLDGDLIWEVAPHVKGQYSALRARALFLLRVDRQLRDMFCHYGEPAVAGGADIPPCGTVKKPGQAMDRTR